MRRAVGWQEQKDGERKKNEGRMKAMHKKKLQLGKKTKKSSLLSSSFKSKIEFLEVKMLDS